MSQNKKSKANVVVPQFETAKITAKIMFIGPDGVARKFNEKHIVAMALEDPKIPGKIWRMGMNGAERDELTETKKK